MNINIVRNFVGEDCFNIGEYFFPKMPEGYQAVAINGIMEHGGCTDVGVYPALVIQESTGKIATFAILDEFEFVTINGDLYIYSDFLFNEGFMLDKVTFR